MESGLRVSKEYDGSGHGSNDSDVSALTWKHQLNLYDEVGAKVIGLFYEGWLSVNGEDLSDWVEMPFGEIKMPMQRAEVFLNYYLGRGHRITVCWAGDDPVGMLLYQPIFDSVIGVRLLYFTERYRASGLGKQAIDSLGGVKLVVFQTRKDSLPDRCLQITAPFRRLISQDDTLCTWEMNWGK